MAGSADLSRLFLFLLFFWSTSLGDASEDSAGTDLRARCLLPDEYLMALNGELCLRSALPCPTTHIRALRRSCVAGDHFGSPPSGCFVSPCRTTAAFDFIIAVAGQAVKQTTGRKAEAPPSLAAVAPCMNLSPPRSADHPPSTTERRLHVTRLPAYIWTHVSIFMSPGYASTLLSRLRSYLWRRYDAARRSN